MTITKASVDPVPIWDQRRDGLKEPPFLSPKQWRLRNDTALARKVKEIEDAWRKSPEAARQLPRNYKELRKRYVPEFGLWSWSGREVDDKNGRNAPLIARLQAVWDALAEASATAQLEKVRQPSLRKQLDTALKAADAFEAQIIELLRERNGRGTISDDDRR